MARIGEKQITRKVVPFEIKATGDAGHGSFEGYAACTKNLDSYGDIIAPGAFAQDLQKFLDEGFIGGLNHNWDKPIGKPTEAREDGKGLFARATLLDTPHAAECRSYIKGGICSKLSIGFATLGRMWCETGDDVKKWWDTHGYAPSDEETEASKYGARILTRVRLFEFSPVMIPANATCDITDSKSSGSPARGRTLDDQFLSALGTVEEFAERMSRYLDRKGQDRRPAAPQRRSQLARLLDRLSELKARMDAPTEEEVAEALRLRAAALALELDADDGLAL